jgi:tetratricopeptide (TPR) repeat protein
MNTITKILITYFVAFVLLFGFFACGTKKEANSTNVAEIKDNLELIEIIRVDQNDRRAENIDWEVVSRNDSLREVRIYQLLDSNKVKTSLDYHNAAMIFQHGRDSVAYGMAVKLMQKSVDLDSNANKWLLAAATDRYLLSIGKPQIYGTQYQKFGEDEPWVLGNMDTTQISDEVREEFGVETLAEQRERVKMMNLKSLLDLFSEGKSIDEIIALIQSNDASKSAYNLSENGINGFGYDLMGLGKNEDALKMFKLNTELYPNGYNTFDSYGECLLLVGRKEEAIQAYKKSLELNPKNDNAKTILNNLK